MRCASVLITQVLIGLVFASSVSAAAPQGDPGKTVLNPTRLKGMKDALTDIEKGQLKQKEFPLPNPPGFGEYLALLKKECGVEWVTVSMPSDNPKNPRAEIDGYNDVMRVEIEHRYGKGILQKLSAKSRADHLEKQKRK